MIARGKWRPLPRPWATRSTTASPWPTSPPAPPCATPSSTASWPSSTRTTRFATGKRELEKLEPRLTQLCMLKNAVS